MTNEFNYRGKTVLITTKKAGRLWCGEYLVFDGPRGSAWDFAPNEETAIEEASHEARKAIDRVLDGDHSHNP